MPDRIKRMIAFVIDWNILYLPAVLLSFLLIEMTTDAVVAFAALAMLALIFGTMALIAARDVIFKGRSLGKRIFGLYIVDKKTLEPISARRRFVRNIFFCLVNWVEILLLLVTGETLGDRVASAFVLSRKNLEMKREEMAEEQGGEAEYSFAETDGFAPNGQPADAVPASVSRPVQARARKQLPPKVLLPLIFGIIVLCMVAFIGLIQIFLHANRDTEQAQAAYDYVVSSNAFATSGLDSEDLRMNEYSVSYVTENGVRTATAEITFTARRGLLRRYAFYVTCHKEGDAWTVCEDCTRIVFSGVGKGN